MTQTSETAEIHQDTPPSRAWFSLREFSGGLGDLGTLIPLSVGVALVTGRDIGLILLFAGLANIATGFLFRLPVAIQPMKAIAAVAIAGGLTANEMSAAGLMVGLAVTLIAVFGWADRLGHVVPKSIVRGIQLGIGVKLGLTGVGFIAARPVLAFDGILVAVALAAAVFLMRNNRSVPVALLLLIAGIAIVVFHMKSAMHLGIDVTVPSIMLTNVESWLTAFSEGALAQLPLTLLNSVIAVCVLSGDLFAGRAIPYRTMALSVGVMNLAACPFGAMPLCHGSGGLAANFRFGARTGGAVVMLGLLLAIVGLLFGSAAMQLLALFPRSVLGVMLVFSGFELMRPVRDQRTVREMAVMGVTAAGIVAIGTLVGFIAGTLVAAAWWIWSRRANAN